MTYTEIKIKKRVKYYYRVKSVRDGKKVRKKRIYLGRNLNKKELKRLEKKADKELILLKNLLTNKEIKFLEKIKQAYEKMKNPLICIAYKVIDDTSDYASKLLFKKQLFKLKVPVFESIELAAKALDKLCTFREFKERQETYKKELISKSLL